MSRRSRGARIEASLALALAGAAVLRLVSFSPARIMPADPERNAAFPEPTGVGNVLIVVPAALAEGNDRSPKSMSEIPAALAWANFAEQEFGAWSAVPATGLAGDDFAQSALVIVARGADVEIAEPQRRALLDWAASGRALLLECPVSPWDETLPAIRAEDADTALIRDDDGTERIWPAPLFPWSSPPPPPDADALALGSPAFLLYERGRGAVAVLRTEFARALFTIQQGMPSQGIDMAPRPWPGRPPDHPLCTVDLYVDRRLPINGFRLESLPWADRLEAEIASCLRGHVFLPRWNRMPNGVRGLLLMTLDEEAVGNGAATVGDAATNRGYPLSCFIIPRKMERRGYRRLVEDGHEIGLHWDRYEWMERIGVPGFRPLLRGVPLETQVEKLASGSGARARLNRNHWLVWDGDFAATFRKLAAAGMTADSSYGPSGLELAGYLFGTGLPFHPLDRNGLPFSLHELPFHLQDDEGFELDTLRVLLRSAEGQTIGVVLHPGTMRYRPSRDVVRLLADAAALARDEGLETARMGDFLEFWRRRASASPASYADESGFRVDCEGFDGAVLDLPPAYRGCGLKSVTIDGRRLAPEELLRGASLEVGPGNHLVRVEYAPPGTTP